MLIREIGGEDIEIAIKVGTTFNIDKYYLISIEQSLLYIKTNVYILEAGKLIKLN